MTKSMTCPIGDCEFQNKVIEGELSLLRDHIFRDHDYLEKQKTAVKLGIIQGLEEKRSAKWLSDHLAEKGVQ